MEICAKCLVKFKAKMSIMYSFCYRYAFFRVYNKNLMGLKLDGNLEIGAHVWSDIDDFICLRHLLRSRAVANLKIWKVLFSFTRAQYMLSYHHKITLYETLLILLSLYRPQYLLLSKHANALKRSDCLLKEYVLRYRVTGMPYFIQFRDWPDIK